MKIENKDFWEKDQIISTQDIQKNAADFELFMFQEAQQRYIEYGEVREIKIFGCGTGREIGAIANFYNPDRIVASDISENMINKCRANIVEWGIDSITETQVSNAVFYQGTKNTFDLVTLLNSMLTYVPNRGDRLTIFKTSLEILKPNASIIGTVHNQVGTPLKTLYFKIRSLFSPFLGETVGNRNTGFKGFKVLGYYYTKNGLQRDLEAAGFKNIEIYSLEEYYLKFNQTYNRKKGYNNLIFISTKP
ncbi:MAG: class I SAM-dependent methyltransferase [Flavobacterium sp.]